MKRTAFVTQLLLALPLLVACPGGGNLAPPTISVQPKSLVVVINTTASFSVEAVGGAPLSYRWQKNGQDLAGATSKSLWIQAVAQADDGALFQVNVSNPAGEAWSCIARLNVVASGAGSSSNPSCTSLAPPGGGPPLPAPTPPAPGPNPPPPPPAPPSPPSPPVPPPPPPNPGDPWRVPTKRWNATFKITRDSPSAQYVVDGSAIFVSSSEQPYAIVSESGSYTVDGYARGSNDPFGCSLLTIRGSGTIGPSDGAVTFIPDDLLVPTRVQYTGHGFSTGGGTTTKTYSGCSPSTPPPETNVTSETWLSIIESPPQFTSPDLRSFSGQVRHVIGDQTTTYEWSFVRKN